MLSKGKRYPVRNSSRILAVESGALPIASDLGNVIITNVRAGLGNQLFQYATGRALAEKTGARLLLDVDTDSSDGRSFLLDSLAIPIRVGSKNDEQIARMPQRGIRRWLAGAGARAEISVFKESKFYAYDARIERIAPPVRLDGFWQSISYFPERKRALQRECQVQRLPGPAIQLSRELARPESVCVHVRRGDYAASEIFRVLSPRYYKNAVGIVRSKVSKPTFFVFSDDPAWARSVMPLDDDVVFISDVLRTDTLSDFALMRSCAHFIVANSTFSFWPAWLCEWSPSVVVTPSSWFKNDHWLADELREEWWLTCDV